MNQLVDYTVNLILSHGIKTWEVLPSPWYHFFSDKVRVALLPGGHILLTVGGPTGRLLKKTCLHLYKDKEIKKAD